MLEQPGEPIPPAVRDQLPADQGLAARARVHHDDLAGRTVSALDAAAFAVGDHIVVRPDLYPPATLVARRVLTHELGHLAQRGGDIPPGDLAMVEDPGAEELAQDAAHGPGAGVAAPVVQRHPITKIGKWTLKKLGDKATKKFVSKHVAKHALRPNIRRISKKAVHSLFKNPRRVKELMTETVEEAVKLGERQAVKAGTAVLEEGAIRITHQAKGAGKFRLLVQKMYPKAIGTKGETVLNVVLDQTGRIVTAFPSKAFSILGLTAAGAATFASSTADAAEAARTSILREEALREASRKASQDDDSWVEWIPIIGDLWGGSLNAGEDQLLAAERERRARDSMIEKVVKDVVRAVEEDQLRSLGPEDVAELREQVLMIITSGLDIESTDAGEVPEEAAP